jgi:proliferating cell nuclear antigen
MFEVCFSNASLFKKIIELTKDFLTEVNLVCTKTDISFKAMADSNIALISVHLDSNGFEKFSCNRDTSIDVNLVLLNKILNRVNNEDSLTISVNDESLDTLNLEFTNMASKRKNCYELRLLEIEQNMLSIPEVNYPVVVEMLSKEFRSVCQDLLVINDVVTITVTENENRVKFTTTSDVGDKGTIELQETDTENPVKISSGSDIEISFSLKYLANISKAFVLSEQVRIYLEKEIPILLEYKMTNGYVRYYLAPRVNELNE